MNSSRSGKTGFMNASIRGRSGPRSESYPSGQRAASDPSSIAELGVAGRAGSGEAGHRVKGAGVVDGGGCEGVTQGARRVAALVQEFQILRRLAFGIPAA